MDRKHGYIPALRFHWLTPAYDAVVRLTTRERRFKRTLIEQAGLSQGQRVLDLACGSGTLAILVKRRFPDIEMLGIDGDPAILARARRKALSAGTDIGFELGFSHELPFPDGHFDCVMSSLFFHHLGYEDKGRAIREILRVLKPGGQVHVADWGRPANGAMRLLYLPIQWLDGFANTQENADGKLMPLFESIGFVNVHEHDHFNTLFGTLRLFGAAKTSAPRSGYSGDCGVSDSTQG